MTWTLNGVKFASGGVATGTFIYDPTTNVYSGVDISIPGLTYTQPPAVVVTGGDLASSATLLEVQQDLSELTLRFVGPGLTAAGGTVLVDAGPQTFDRVSRETTTDPDTYLPVYDNIVRGGSVTATAAVPEPSSVLLIFTMIAGVAGFKKLKVRK